MHHFLPSLSATKTADPSSGGRAADRARQSTRRVRRAVWRKNLGYGFGETGKCTNARNPFLDRTLSLDIIMSNNTHTIE